MSFRPEKSCELRQDISGNAAWLALAIVSGMIVFALLPRSERGQTSPLEFVARDYYDR